MKILVACECSGRVRDAFRARGHDAWSCDLKPCERGSRFHLQGDVRSQLEYHSPGNLGTEGWRYGHRWDLLIAFPDCTYLTNSAAWAYKNGPYHQRVKPGTLVGAARREARREAIAFVKLLLGSNVKRIALENPVGILSTVLRKPDQIIQPHWFGEDASKGTCLWLVGLPKLVPTKFIAPRMVNGKPRWANQTDSGQNRLTPGQERAADRARTYPGIADAMAEQWGKL